MKVDFIKSIASAMFYQQAWLLFRVLLKFIRNKAEI